MAIAIYGGSFDPPHLGHVHVAEKICDVFKPEKLMVIPAGIPPHKLLAQDSAGEQHRLEMCALAFERPGAEISDMELKRAGKSYTADTLNMIARDFSDRELILAVGTDMFLSLDTWNRAEEIFRLAHICVVRRDEKCSEIELKKNEYESRFDAVVSFIRDEPLTISSSDIRSLLKKREGRAFLPEGVYDYIISKRLYGARPEWDWLREKAYSMLKPKRIPHVAGCEQEAISLAKRWGENPDDAAEAAILHDITKRDELSQQLILCEKYGIIPDKLEAKSEKLLHSKTGAAIARERFGVSSRVEEAIRWHTTGKPDMTKLEKIIYLADYIEPSRDFPGLDRLRRLAYEDLDRALVLGFEMSLEDLASYGSPAHKNTLDALEWYRKKTEH